VIETPGEFGQRHGGGHLTHDRAAVRGKIQEGRGDDAQDEHDERSRDPRQPSPQHGEDDQRGHAHRERPAVGVRELCHQAGELLERVVPTARDPEQLGQLANDDRDGQPDHESGDHGLGQELGQEPEPQEPGHEQRAADHQGERRHQAGVHLDAAAGHHRRDHDRRHQRDRRARRDLQVPRRAEQRADRK
jgi:hypothetical protein